MLFGSTSKNLSIISLTILTLSILGIFYFEFSVNNIFITVLSFYILNIFGNWMTLHRYYSHKSFEFKYEIIRKFFTVLAILSARGSPLAWTYIHRQHHAYSDTSQDPHSPKILGFKLFGFGHLKNSEQEKMKLFLVKDLMNAEQLFIHKYYILILLILLIPIGFIDISFLYFSWILPTLLVQISQNIFFYFGHMKGYRNFDTKDDSKNSIWFFPFILGEAWHNNHHKNASLYNTSVKWWEIDPISYVIRLVRNKNQIQ